MVIAFARVKQRKRLRWQHQSLASRHSRPATGRHNRLGDRSGKSVGGMAWFLPDSGGRHRTVARNRMLAESSPLRRRFATFSRTPGNPLLETLAATIGRDVFTSLPLTFVSPCPPRSPHCSFSFLSVCTGFSLLAAPMSAMTRPSRRAPTHVSLRSVAIAHLRSSRRI